MHLSSNQPRIVIVGAGVAGLSFAIALKQDYKFENFIIFEKADSVGGTWRDNIYPGCSSDVGIYFYSLSREPKADWTTSHPFQPEICAYWEELACKYDLHSHIRFGRNVASCVWDAHRCIWAVTTEDVQGDAQETVEAEILLSAIGVLEVPRYPNIPGLSDFKGLMFHSARWHQVDLRGKKVAVIGNGASATQFLPIIAKEPGIQVMQFIRTPNWILPPIRKFYSSFHIWCMKYVPFLRSSARFLGFCQGEFLYFAIFKFNWTNRLVSSYLTRYMRKNAPPDEGDRLVPKYSPGCKRIIFDTDYLPALRQANVSLNWDGVSSFCADGIVTKKNDLLTFDAIILATGYTADRFPLPVRGVNDQTIQEYHDSQGGPTAYLGTTTPGFPNFFTLAGPNTATGHTSVIFTEEVQIDYILRTIRPVLERKIVYLSPRASASDEYNEKIQKRLSHSVFTGCSSWYRVNGTEKVSSIFPGAGTLFWWWLRRPNWEHYNIVRP